MAIHSCIVPDALRSNYETVSEALLDLSEGEITSMRLNAPLVCHANPRVILPSRFVFQSSGNKMLGLRESLWGDPPRSGPNEDNDPSTRLESFFPPEGEVGFWDATERFYRTRYMQKAAFDKPRMPKETAERMNMKDLISFWHLVERGDIVPFLDDTIDATPPDLEQPWVYRFHYDGRECEWRLSTGFRGCPEIYEYPFRPSAFRRFSSIEEAAPFESLRRFLHNLLVEFLWSTQQIPLGPLDTEALIQHYKLLPWSYMVDVSYDINIAKAFACMDDRESDRCTPVIYKVILLNVDYYDLGASFLGHLPFERPRTQNAMSLFGLNQAMCDPTGVIVSLTEHPLYYACGTTTWERFGGVSFRIGEREFSSVFLDKGEQDHLYRALYPQEPPEVFQVLSLISSKVKERLGSFHLAKSDEDLVLKRLSDLNEELTARR